MTATITAAQIAATVAAGGTAAAYYRWSTHRDDIGRTVHQLDKIHVDREGCAISAIAIGYVTVLATRTGTDRYLVRLPIRPEDEGCRFYHRATLADAKLFVEG